MKVITFALILNESCTHLLLLLFDNASIFSIWMVIFVLLKHPFVPLSCLIGIRLPVPASETKCGRAVATNRNCPVSVSLSGNGPLNCVFYYILIICDDKSMLYSFTVFLSSQYFPPTAWKLRPSSRITTHHNFEL